MLGKASSKVLEPPFPVMRLDYLFPLNYITPTGLTLPHKYNTLQQV